MSSSSEDDDASEFEKDESSISEFSYNSNSSSGMYRSILRVIRPLAVRIYSSCLPWLSTRAARAAARLRSDSARRALSWSVSGGLPTVPGCFATDTGTFTGSRSGRVLISTAALPLRRDRNPVPSTICTSGGEGVSSWETGSSRESHTTPPEAAVVVRAISVSTPTTL